MGYFSSGTEGIDYMERWCQHCANCGDDAYEFGCSVWDLHSLYQADRDFRAADGGPVGRLLDALIPRTDKGLGNGQCKMFRPRINAHELSFLEWFDSLHGAPNG
jgi:hypothetical protein